MLLKLIYLQDIENLMVDYEYYIQDILESTKTTTLYQQRAKMEEVSHYSLRPEHFRRGYVMKAAPISQEGCCLVVV